MHAGAGLYAARAGPVRCFRNRPMGMRPVWGSGSVHSARTADLLMTTVGTIARRQTSHGSRRDSYDDIELALPPAEHIACRFDGHGTTSRISSKQRARACTSGGPVRHQPWCTVSGVRGPRDHGRSLSAFPNAGLPNTYPRVFEAVGWSATRWGWGLAWTGGGCAVAGADATVGCDRAEDAVLLVALPEVDLVAHRGRRRSSRA